MGPGVGWPAADRMLRIAWRWSQRPSCPIKDSEDTTIHAPEQQVFHLAPDKLELSLTEAHQMGHVFSNKTPLLVPSGRGGGVVMETLVNLMHCWPRPRLWRPIPLKFLCNQLN